ncbi:hypothetical protein LguiB_008519 [Lonicera macranthoides]
MAVSIFQYFILLVLLVTSSTSCLGRVISEKPNPLFIFGDSLFDAGNNNYINTTIRFQANFWPYGETFFNYPTGRVSDGRIIPDFIAEYAKLPLIQPYLQPQNHEFAYGTNFASAGAGALVETSPGMAINLKTQLSYFKKVERQLAQKIGDNEAKKLVSSAVYLFSIASNDYTYPFVSSSAFFHSYTHDEYVKMVIGNITTVIKGIYKKGGRKFGFTNLAPLGCLPFGKALIQGNTGNQYCVEEMIALVKLHNKALYKSLQSLERELKEFSYSHFDLYTAVTERMENPGKYGFKEGGRACCGSGPFRGQNSCGGKRGIKEYELCKNPSEYLFFDSGHPTEFASQQAAGLFWSGTSYITWPHSLKQLFQPTQH